MANLDIRGVSYMPAAHSPGGVTRALQAIKDDLHCTSVMVLDSDRDRLVETARVALAADLDVVVRPHLDGGRPAAILEHLRPIARAAEALRREHPGRVTLLVGSEFSLTSRGIVPGPHQFVRLAVILRARRVLRGRIDRRVDALLAKAAAVARQEFGGPLSYAAAGWETVDWSRFDLTCVNLYRSGEDPDAYRRRVTDLIASTGNPVVISEFGCGAFAGADRRGAGSFRIVNWFSDPPRVRPGHGRDEGVQARYLEQLIELYAAEGVSGCFAFTFCMPDFPHGDDPETDLDMAGFGLVKTPRDDPEGWEPKQAFHAVARSYRQLS